MTRSEFQQSLSQDRPPNGLGAALQALWWGRRGDWDRAHRIVMDESDRDSAWVHAWLHRVEGDLDNARYWYRQARRPEALGPTDAEWEAIVGALLGSDS